MKSRNLKKEKGITLIALVVTIVVLLILAGVSISMVLGNNGLITRAKDAKEKTEQDQLNTEKAINSLVDEMDAILGNGGSGNTGNGDGDGDGTGNGDEPTTVDGVTIPVGFYYVGGTKDGGLVISDNSADENKYKDQETVGTDLEGNQFVWIPVENYDNFHLIEGYYSGSLQTKLSAASNPSREAGATEVAGTPLANNNTEGTPESIAMYKSVKDNKGFYIARYEAGISGTKANSELEINNQIVADGNTKPLSKYGVGVWNQIPGVYLEISCAPTGTTTGDGAEKVARSMYTKSSTCGVTSTLCYGVQWDAIMNFIDSNYLTGTCTDNSFVKNSEGKGNHGSFYSGTISTTGYYAVKNIYDLAGNVTEMTMENGYVTRGSFFWIAGSGYPESYFPASYRGNGNGNGYGDENTGFRVALYL